MASLLAPAQQYVDAPVFASVRPHSWRRDYAQLLIFSDLAVLTVAIYGSGIALGLLDAPLVGPKWLDVTGGDGMTYVGVSAGLLAVWMVGLAATGSRHHRVLGLGAGEFKAIMQSTASALVLFALVSVAFRIEFSRSYILLALAMGIAALSSSRLMWRRWLQARRRTGDFCSRTLVVGSIDTATQIANELQRHPDAGYQVVGATVTSTADVTHIAVGVPVLGSVDRVMSAVKHCQADTVIVTDGHQLAPGKLRELSWGLEPGRQHLVLAPSLTDIAGPRIHARPVAGLPLVHVESPRYEGIDRFAKRAFDVVASFMLLILLSVPLLAVAALVVRTSPGGVFFTHERIGKRGRPFRIVKFRSMVADADSHLQALLRDQGAADQPLFKVSDDPRITPVGRLLRRYSIDEVPQLLNVLKGDMSLVGPRPQVAKEVALYDDAATRRLFVKPGMTGLWQVSGRSRLSWNESVRLDLFYVENWSMAADVVILMRTVRAVLGSDGAV